MDPITALIASSKIKVGLWGKDFFTFLTTNFEWFFDAIANGLTYVLQGLINILLWMPPVVVVLAIAALAWGLQRSWKLAVGVALGLAFIINQGLWKETVETLVLVVGAAAAEQRTLDRRGVAVVAADEQPVTQRHPSASIERRLRVGLAVDDVVHPQHPPVVDRCAPPLAQLRTDGGRQHCGVGFLRRAGGRDQRLAGRRVGRRDVAHHRHVERRSVERAVEHDQLALQRRGRGREPHAGRRPRGRSGRRGR